MANFTAAQLLAIINKASPVFNALQFYGYPQDPKQRLYPSVDITEVNPQSNDKTVQLINYKTKFEINIYNKWANRQTDLANLETLERNILAKILAATLTTGKLILENNDFQRFDIKDNPLKVNGVQSTLTLYFDELAATVGIIGLQQTLDIGSISGLQIIGEIASSGRDDKRRANDIGLTKISRGLQADIRFWEYMYTKANYDIIQALINADSNITVTLHEQTQADTVLLGKPVYQRSSTRYDGQKTTILQFEVDDYSDS